MGGQITIGNAVASRARFRSSGKHRTEVTEGDWVVANFLSVTPLLHVRDFRSQRKVSAKGF
jgi:hypothetical protein